ncbi:hypothetical protein L9X51_19310 [Vibrio aestuarianus]|uniref:Uncharacterized protein n=1 Tax=Vibrio aestuarianus TaxID=28171 RepID=A0A9X4FI21_9VIBR|nr:MULTISPECIES: hypothetical protein [Vibrio]MDE1348507.1 hypothetical protein [Vibrio aestuarianus]
MAFSVCVRFGGYGIVR